MNRSLQLFLAALLGGVVAAMIVLNWMGPSAQVVLTTDDIIYRPQARLVGRTPDAIPATIDLRTAARTATPAVVHITARSGGRRREAVKELFGPRDDSPRPGGEGSGVIYTSNGYIITNFHVVKDAQQISVSTTDRRTFPA
ncbi:MAG: peptidase A2, partial [Bacteroidota bacterium]